MAKTVPTVPTESDTTANVRNDDQSPHKQVHSTEQLEAPLVSDGIDPMEYTDSRVEEIERASEDSMSALATSANDGLSSGQLRLHISNFSQFFRGDAQVVLRQSKTIWLNGLGWSIVALPRSHRNRISLSYFLKCSGTGGEKDEWTCDASATLAVLGVENEERQIKHTYTHNEQLAGYESFISAETLMGRGFVVDDSISLLALLEAEKPIGSAVFDDLISMILPQYRNWSYLTSVSSHKKSDPSLVAALSSRNIGNDIVSGAEELECEEEIDGEEHTDISFESLSNDDHDMSSNNDTAEEHPMTSVNPFSIDSVLSDSNDVVSPTQPDSPLMNSMPVSAPLIINTGVPLVVSSHFPAVAPPQCVPALTAHPVETLLYHSINVDPPTQPISSQVHPMPLTVYTGTPIDLSSLLGLTASGAAVAAAPSPPSLSTLIAPHNIFLPTNHHQSIAEFRSIASTCEELAGRIHSLPPDRRRLVMQAIEALMNMEVGN